MKIDRLMGITTLLLKNKIMSAHELADIFEVSVRTIYRDIDSLELSGIPIITYAGKYGGVSIQENYKLDHQVFSQNDLSNLLSSISSLTPFLSKQELSSIKSKLNYLVPQEQKEMIDLKANQVIVDYTNWRNYKQVNSYLEQLKKALQKNRIQFMYKDELRHVEPYQLLLKENNWYLHSYCLDKQDSRLFKLSRMSELSISNETFTLNPEFAYSSKGKEFKHDTIDVTLRIHNSILPIWVERYGAEIIQKQEREYTIVIYPFHDAEFYYEEVLAFGQKCEVLSPNMMRERFANRVRELSNLYKKALD